MSQSALTDRNFLYRARQRARRIGMATFLHDQAAAEIEERLSEINRTFTAPAIVTGFPDLWQGRIPGAVVVPDDDMLHLGEGAHDLVIHAMCLHWSNDPVGQVIQCRRALRPDGLFLGVLPGGRTLNELRSCLAEAESKLSGGLSPRVLPMAEIRDIGGLLQRAGLALPVADATTTLASYTSAFALMKDLRAMGEQNALAARPRGVPFRRRLFAETAEVYARTFPAPGERIAATFELVFLTGWAPDPSQQRPLRPGSAVARLADALGNAGPRKNDATGGAAD